MIPLAVEIAEAQETLRIQAGLLDACPTAMMIHDLQGRILYANRIAIEVHGYTRDEFFGLDVHALHPAKSQERAAAELEKIRHQKSVPYECVHRRKDGSPLPLLVQARIAQWNGREVILIVATDLTVEAQAANTAKCEFLANVTHELRTPLNGILGLTGLLLQSEPDPERRGWAELIQNCGLQLLRMINDVLDVSRIESGLLALDLAPFDPRGVLAGVVAKMSEAAGSKKLTLSSTVDPRVPEVLYGDRGRLEQIIHSLGSNALKFTHQGTISLSAQLESADEQRVVVKVAVRDTGIGIAQDRIGALFHPFTQVDGSPSRRYGGTGLGLSLAKQLAELMGGAIGVESTPGLGSSFWFTAVFLRQARSSNG